MFHPAAEIERYDAAYYESQRRGLDGTFLQAIETAMDEIREHPMASPQPSSDSRHGGSKAPTALLVETSMKRDPT